MTDCQVISTDLGIPKTVIRQCGNQLVHLIVPEGWVSLLKNKRYVPLEARFYEKLENPSQLLQVSTRSAIQRPWKRITVRVVSKSSETAVSLVSNCLCYKGNDLTFGETAHRAVHDYWQNVERNARYKYAHAYATKTAQSPLPTMDRDKTMEQLLQRLFKCDIIDMTSQQAITSQTPYSPSDPSEICHPNILPAIAILSSKTHFYIVHPFTEFSLQDVVTLSPAFLSKSYSKNMFIAYQLLHAMRFCHVQGLSVGDLNLHDIYIDEKLWVQLQQPQIDRVCLQKCSEEEEGELQTSSQSTPSGASNSASMNHVDSTKASRDTYSFDAIIEKHRKRDLATLTQMWVHGELSNYEYIMILNYLAGRRMDEPNQHPVFPWIMDFSSQSSGFRDMSKSKYRLNKGDQQLDHTFHAVSLSLPTSHERLHIPHHISDVLSDITYYVYMARRTPKSVLCSHVRQNWVPHEYPASIQRLQEWTPEECIPEFFTDPTVFTSIHPDLPDLEIPDWAATPQDFVNKHMAALEGYYVSLYIHHWIDLTFGYKLSGQAAVKAKNVCLQLVDEHTHLVKHGVVQLFHTPHPQRLAPHPPWTPSQLKMNPSSSNIFRNESATDLQSLTSKNQKDKKSKNATPTPDKSGEITLPSGFNPLLLLDKYETLSNFLMTETKSLPNAYAPQETGEDDTWFARHALVSRDLQALGCALVSLVLNERTRSVGAHAGLQERYILCRRVCQQQMHDIPRSFHQVLHLLFRLQEPSINIKPDKYGALFHYPILSDKKLPPPNIDLLLHSQFGILPFPDYFSGLFDLFYKYHVIEQDINNINASVSIDSEEKSRTVTRLYKDMVSVFAKYLNRVTFDVIGVEGMELLLPYIESLFASADTAVQSIWLLFAPISLMLGASQTREVLLPHIVAVFDDEMTTSKHMKLYHRSFVIQLVVRLGLDTFLNSFSKPLIESCSGYKDFFPSSATAERPLASENEDMMQHSITDTFLNETLSPQPVTFSLTGESDSLNDEPSNWDTERGGLEFLEHLLLEDGPLRDTSSLNEPDEQGNKSKSSEDDRSDNSDPNQSIGSEEMGLICGSVGTISVHSVSRLLGRDEPEDDGKMSSSKLDPHVDEIAEPAEEDNSFEVHSERRREARSFGQNKIAQVPAAPHEGSECNISDVAAETIKWLSHRLGPVLTAKYLSRNLLRMLAVCYLGREQLMPTDEKELPFSLTGRAIIGDINTTEVLECLSCIAIMYGEQIILLQYFTHVKQLVMAAQTKITSRTEAGLVGCISLITHIIPHVSDSTLMDILHEALLADSLMPILKVVASPSVSFPNGSIARRAICFKLIDVLYVISMRIGFENTRVHMTLILQSFFVAFNTVYASVNGAFENCGDGASTLNGVIKQDTKLTASESGSTLYALKMDSRTRECKIDHYVPSYLGHRRQGSEGSRHSLSPPVEEEQESQDEASSNQNTLLELKETFTPEMAHSAYIPFCRLAGDIYIGQNLVNDDLIRQLCAIHDQSLLQQQKATSPQRDLNDDDHRSVIRQDSTEEGSAGGFGRNVSMVGNKITLQDDVTGAQCKKQAAHRTVDYSLLKSDDIEMHYQRHLRGNWLQYWEHEVGLVDAQDSFNFKQIKLMTCAGPDSSGHSSSVRSLCVLDNENSFLSSSKDKTVKLWSLRNFGDGTGKVGCQWTYANHKKSVFAVTFLDSLRYAASCDSTVHVWDPFVGMGVRTFESSKHAPVTVLTSMPSPHTTLVTATTDSLVRFLDVRQGHAAQEIRCTTGPAGLIRCAAVSPDAQWVAVGYSTGVVSLIDARTGMLMASWKAHEGEILQVKAYSNKKLVTSSFDQSMAVWNTEEAKMTNPLRGILEPVHCFSFYKNYVVSASTANKIGVHSVFDSKGSCSITKLTNDVFRGVLTTMAVLPMNRLLLLGADNGQIRLVA